jgi:hypothetical protein
MLRHFGAAVAVLALLCGFASAPYTHAHHAVDSASDARHPHGDSLVHSHASPHAHREADGSGRVPGGKGAGDEQIWAVDGFVFQPPVSSHAPSPVLQAVEAPYVQLTSRALAADRLQPQAHGPPVGSPPGLRAPPAFLPAFD